MCSHVCESGHANALDEKSEVLNGTLTISHANITDPGIQLTIIADKVKLTILDPTQKTLLFDEMMHLPFAEANGILDAILKETISCKD